jgi:hypothetical protein
MKNNAIAIMVGLILLTTSGVANAASGSAFGTLATAQALGQGSGNFGLGVGIADATSFVGTYAFGLSTYADGRIKLGLIDAGNNSDTEFVLGADYKWQFWSYGQKTNHPFDFAVGGFMEFGDFGSVSVLQLGGQLLASYPARLSNGRTLSPYGRFNARLESISLDLPAGSRGDDSKSNLEVGLNLGVAWEMSPTVNLYGEVQFDGNDGLFIGIDFNVM